jgi:hypothetical protein
MGDTGKVSKIQILPNNVPELLECLQNSFQGIQFPKFKNPRQMATYSINIRGKAPATE